MAGEGKDKGWISLYRSIQDHWLWQEEKKYSKLKAWLDLLLLVNHKGGKVLIGNELVKIDIGSHLTSQEKLMKRWGWGKEKVRNFLSILEDENMIKTAVTKKYTIISIINYEMYQKQTGTKLITSMDIGNEQTTNRPQTDYNQTTNRLQSDTNNNDNNDNNSSCSSRELQGVINCYCDRSLILESNINTVEIQTMIDLLEEIPIDTIKKGIDEAFKNFIPKFKGDKIKSFKYCEPVIRNLWAKSQIKEGEDSGQYKPDNSKDKGKYNFNRPYTGPVHEGEIDF